MKDEDLHKNILLSHEQSKRSWDQLNADTRFLTNLGIMDYSLLLGIYYIGVSSDDVLDENPNDGNGHRRQWSFAHGFMYQQEGVGQDGVYHSGYTPPFSPTLKPFNNPSKSTIHDEQHMRIQIDEYDREMAKRKLIMKAQQNSLTRQLQLKQSKLPQFHIVPNKNNKKYNVESHLLATKANIASIVEEDETMMSLHESNHSSIIEPQPRSFNPDVQHKNSIKTDPEETPSERNYVTTDDEQMIESGQSSPYKKHSLIEMKELQNEQIRRSIPMKIDNDNNDNDNLSPTNKRDDDISSSMKQNVGSYSNVNINIGTPEAMGHGLIPPDKDRNDSISYLKLDPSRKKSASNTRNFNEPSITIPTTLAQAGDERPDHHGMSPISPSDDDDETLHNEAHNEQKHNDHVYPDLPPKFRDPRSNSTITTTKAQRGSSAYHQTISSPTETNNDLVSSYNTAQQRMSFGGQAPSALVPSEDLDNKTLRDIQSVAPDDEQGIKLLKHESGFLRRRAFTSTSGLEQVSDTKNTFKARTIEGPGFYCLGIIDILQEWNWNKKLERFFKIYFRCQDSYGISCIEPSLYRKRFLAKMLQIGIGRKTAHV